MKKWLVLAVFLAVTGTIGWLVYDRLEARKKDAASKASSPGAPSGKGGGGGPVAVEIGPVRQAPIRDVREFPGTLMPRSQFTVAPRVGGRLKRLACDVGDRIRNGQAIAEIDDEDYRLAVEQAGADVQVAKANEEEARSALEAAKRELERVRSLQEKKIASASELDTAQSLMEAKDARLKVAQAQVTRANVTLETAKVRLADTRIAAVWPKEPPPDGGSPGNGAEDFRVVGERFVDEGALLSPNAPILTLLDLRTVKAVLHATERDVPLLREGQGALLAVDAYPERTFPGTIVRISPVLKEATRKLRAEIEAPNPDLALKAGMYLRIRIEVARRDGATIVPAAALLKREGVTGVFLADLEAKTVRFVPVTLGLQNEKTAEVIQPPLSGSVVTMGQHLLKDGSAFALPGERAGRQSEGGESKDAPPGGGERKGARPEGAKGGRGH